MKYYVIKLPPHKAFGQAFTGCIEVNDNDIVVTATNGILWAVGKVSTVVKDWVLNNNGTFEEAEHA